MGEVLLTHKLVGERLELAAGGSWTAPHAGELEAQIAELQAQLAERMAGYLRAYGSTWPEEDLRNLSLLLYEFGWAATFHTVGQSADAVARIYDWTRQAQLDLIESCLDGEARV